MTGFNSSGITRPFNISIVTSNGTDQLKTLVAPPWVSTPNVRGTSDILQSCVLTLVGCIYTALHLDVPKKTTWQHLLWKKFKWVVITLFAPEIAVFVAATQLRYAWNLKSAFRKIQKEQQELSKWAPDADFKINLQHAFFIIMGAVRFDVHDIFSLTDLDKAHCNHFEKTVLGRRSVRSAPASIIWLAERGHWIKIRKQDIDDKSKADTVQKALVLIQVLWMVTQCIARRIINLPLSLLEIHTIVHVVCAVLLYICWLEEAIIIPTERFRGDLAIMLQRHFYSNIPYKMALFPPKENEEQPPPVDADGSQMLWFDPQSGAAMSEGDILPSGLALSAAKVKEIPNYSTYYLDPQGESIGISFKPESEFLARWDAILTKYPSGSRERLAQSSNRIVMWTIDRRDEPQDLTSVQKILYVTTLSESEPPGWVTDQERLF
ncbi:unnamed protein product [Fusarium langsethiae]|nr:unnamed protein product [Fusarium langsethiae]